MSNPVKASLLRAKALYTGFVLGTPTVDGVTLEVTTDAHVKSGGIGSSQLAAGAVDATALATGAVTAAKNHITLLRKHTIPLASVVDPTGLVHAVGAGGGVGLFTALVTSNVRWLNGQTADGNTKTSICIFEFSIPKGWADPGDGTGIKVRVPTELKSVTGTGVTNNGSDIDVSAYLQAHGAVGSDLCTTNAQTYAALDTWYDKDFVITSTGLVAGDILVVKITGRAIESNAGNGTLQTVIEAPSMLVDSYDG